MTTAIGEELSTTDPVEVRVEVGAHAASVELGDSRASIDFSVPVRQSEIDTLTSTLVFKQMAGSRVGDFARDIGMRLFAAVFAGPASTVYAKAFEQAEQRASGVRFRIEVTSPELQALPWELLYDPDINRDFVALLPGCTVARHAGSFEPSPQSPRPTDKLAVLAVVPSDDHDYRKILYGLDGEPQLAVDVRAAMPAAHEYESPDVLHLHGVDDVGAPDEEQILPVGDSRMSVADLVQSLSGRLPPRAVLLDAFPTDQVAAELAQRVPAVIGFRAGSAASRTRFVDAFYRSLAKGDSVETAVANGRAIIDMNEPGRPDWSYPVLYQSGVTEPPLAIGLDAARSRGPTVAEVLDDEAAVPATAKRRDEAAILRLRIQSLSANISALNERWSTAASVPPTIARRRQELEVERSACERRLGELT